MSVGVMKDYKLKQRDLGVSHTLGGLVTVEFFKVHIEVGNLKNEKKNRKKR